MTSFDDLVRDFAKVINYHSRENGSNTPDFVLAEYLVHCLQAYEIAIVQREAWSK